MALPLPPLTRTIGSLGPYKEDEDLVPDDIHYPKAEEWNIAMDAIKDNRTELNNLGLAGATGTLQNAYNNGILNPTLIQVDGVRGRIQIRDSNPSQGVPLITVAGTAGANEYGLAPEGYRLRDHAQAIHSQTGIAVRMQSGQAKATGPAYVFDTATEYNGSAYFRLSAVGQTVAQIVAGSIPELQFWNGAGAMLARLIASPATLRLNGDAASVDFLPRSAGDGFLGSSSEPWRAVHAWYHRGTVFSVPYNAALSIDASQGEMATVILTGNVNSLTITNFGSGQKLAIKFIQDGVGGRTLSGLMGAIRLVRDVPFTLSPAAGAQDVLYLYSDGLQFHEVARKQDRPPEYRVKRLSLAGPPTVDITPHVSEHTWIFDGVLNGPAIINLSRTNAKEGDRIFLEFDEVTGLQTDAVNTLTIQENGAGSLKVYNAAGLKLRGQVSAVYTGTAWAYNPGGCLSYA